MSTEQAFITSSGSFLPGPPICNEEIESVLVWSTANRLG